MPYNSKQIDVLVTADVGTLEDLLKRYQMDKISRKQVELIIASKLGAAMPVAPDKPLPKRVSAELKKRDMANTFLLVYRTIYRAQLIEHGDPIQAHANAMQLAEYELRQMVHLRGKRRARKSKRAAGRARKGRKSNGKSKRAAKAN